MAVAFGSYRTFIFSHHQPTSCATILGLDNKSGIFQLTSRHETPIHLIALTCIKYLDN